MNRHLVWTGCVCVLLIVAAYMFISSHSGWTFVSTDGRISLAVPSGWTRRPPSFAATLLWVTNTKQQNIEVFEYSCSCFKDGAAVSDFTDAVVSDYQNTLSDFSGGQTADVTLGKLPARQATFSGTRSTGEQRAYLAVACTDGTYFYLLLGSAEPSKFGNPSDYQSIFQTFKLLDMPVEQGKTPAAWNYNDTVKILMNDGVVSF